MVTTENFSAIFGDARPWGQRQRPGFLTPTRPGGLTLRGS